MKLKISLFILLFGISSADFAQDTSANQKISQDQTYPMSTRQNNNQNNTNKTQNHIYRDTRLGGSSPHHRTYKSNDYGAGAITTNPHKANGKADFPGDHFDSSNLKSKVYRDTRLGGSSPHHRTYKSNDYGAGAITTDPHKGNGSSVPAPQ